MTHVGCSTRLWRYHRQALVALGKTRNAPNTPNLDVMVLALSNQTRASRFHYQIILCFAVNLYTAQSKAREWRLRGTRHCTMQRTCGLPVWRNTLRPSSLMPPTSSAAICSGTGGGGLCQSSASLHQPEHASLRGCYACRQRRITCYAAVPIPAI